MMTLKQISRSVLTLGLLFILLNAFQFATAAQSNLPRYLILQNQFVFERHDELPYEMLGPMCWNEVEGWCDEGMDQQGHRIVYLIDYETGRHGVVMQNDAGCWLWWFRENYGDDNNPHIAEHSWITCPAPIAANP